MLYLLRFIFLCDYTKRELLLLINSRSYMYKSGIGLFYFIFDYNVWKQLPNVFDVYDEVCFDFVSLYLVPNEVSIFAFCLPRFFAKISLDRTFAVG